MVLIKIALVPVHVTDLPVVNVHVDELSSARIWQHKLCASYFASVNYFATLLKMKRDKWFLNSPSK
jgi:hypothetical protein